MGWQNEVSRRTFLRVTAGAALVTAAGCGRVRPEVVRRRMPPMPDIDALAREITSSREAAENILKVVNALQIIRTEGTPMGEPFNGVSVSSETETYTVTQFRGDVPYRVTNAQGEQLINKGERITSGNDLIKLVRLDVLGANLNDAVVLRKPRNIVPGEKIYSISKYIYTDPETNKSEERIRIIDAQVLGEKDGQIEATVPPVNYNAIGFNGLTPTQLEHPSDIFSACAPTSAIVDEKGNFWGVATYRGLRLNVATIGFTPISLTPQPQRGLKN